MVSDAKIRTFRWDDLERYTYLFNEINGITTSEKAYDAEFMRQLLSQPSCEPEKNCFLVETQGVVVGFTLVTPEPLIDRAVASGGVLEAYRNQGIGHMLLTAAMEHSRESDVSVMHVEASATGTAAHHVLESEGFYEVKRFWQMRWEGDNLPPVGLPDGFWLRSFNLGEDEEILTDLQNTAFGQNWGFSPNTVEQISARVRLSRSNPEGIIFIVDGDRVSGYNWTLRSFNENNSTGWVAMTGVHPDYRGRGLGKSVVLAGMEYLKSKNVDGIELEVDSENDPARELYLKIGYKKIGQTVWFEKRLK
ncbi:MAG: GNAT family N-acetyltransferase [Chloroflexi bacterium]|nr:GNAT family N-acetyltransferase [Chloroflexota bacterium]